MLSIYDGDGKPTAIGDVTLLTRLMDIAEGVITLPESSKSVVNYRVYARNIIGVAKKALLYMSAAEGMRVPD